MAAEDNTRKKKPRGKIAGQGTKKDSVTTLLFKTSNENKAGHVSLCLQAQQYEAEAGGTTCLKTKDSGSLTVIDECVCMYELFSPIDF